MKLLKKWKLLVQQFIQGNPCYPEEHEILQQGMIVTWEDVRDGAGLIGNSDFIQST